MHHACTICCVKQQSKDRLNPNMTPLRCIPGEKFAARKAIFEISGQFSTFLTCYWKAVGSYVAPCLHFHSEASISCRTTPSGASGWAINNSQAKDADSTAGN